MAPHPPPLESKPHVRTSKSYRSSARLQIFSYIDNFIHDIGYCMLHTAVPHTSRLQIFSYNDNFIHDIGYCILHAAVPHTAGCKYILITIISYII